jgi:Kef-type K+ transport system membrane component KefB
MKRAFLIYGLTLLILGAGLYWALEYGGHLRAPLAERAGTPVLLHQHRGGDSPSSIGTAIKGHLEDPLALLFLQLIVIVLATRCVGTFFSTIGQPSVIGEMAAGLLLGPSLLGWAWPDGYQLIFPTESFGMLKMLSQIGVCLYLFVVGMELDVEHLRHRAYRAVVVSHASIVLPYFLGVLASLWLYSNYAAPKVAFIPFALFMGIAMSITAFPVLARILDERRLTKTPLGSTAITCAAVDDVTAWTLLAMIVAIVHAGGMASALRNLALLLVFVAVMLWIIRRQLPSWMQVENLDHGVPNKSATAGVLVLILASALSTELIGIHALFGAFMAGVIMPKHAEFRRYVSVRVEQFSSVFLLPLFFAFTGLRTQLGLMNDLSSWLVCGGLILLATAGKLGGSMLAARLTGMTWSDSFSLGALMNTRGLMELIALNLGYDFGILSPRIFAMMVLMALTTTTMTGPLLSLTRRRELVPRPLSPPHYSEPYP